MHTTLRAADLGFISSAVSLEQDDHIVGNWDPSVAES
jgi:hypothetical protein